MSADRGRPVAYDADDSIAVLEELARRAAATDALDVQWGVALGSMLADGYRLLEPGQDADLRVGQLERLVDVIREGLARIKPMIRAERYDEAIEAIEALRQMRELPEEVPDA